MFSTTGLRTSRVAQTSEDNDERRWQKTLTDERKWQRESQHHASRKAEDREKKNEYGLELSSKSMTPYRRSNSPTPSRNNPIHHDSSYN